MCFNKAYFKICIRQNGRYMKREAETDFPTENGLGREEKKRESLFHWSKTPSRDAFSNLQSRSFLETGLNTTKMVESIFKRSA